MPGSRLALRVQWWPATNAAPTGMSYSWRICDFLSPVYPSKFGSFSRASVSSSGSGQISQPNHLSAFGNSNDFQFLFFFFNDFQFLISLLPSLKNSFMNTPFLVVLAIFSAPFPRILRVIMPIVSFQLDWKFPLRVLFRLLPNCPPVL